MCSRVRNQDLSSFYFLKSCTKICEKMFFYPTVQFIQNTFLGNLQMIMVPIVSFVILYFLTLKSDYAKYKPELSPSYEYNDFLD